ncbi:hypothetical protein GJ496_010047 [Pomphorhynchus laevis]|nr:hypothetical protein GJ496_010047 [Pomphorhynchus laevis]
MHAIKVSKKYCDFIRNAVQCRQNSNLIKPIRYSERLIVGFSPEELFDVVCDVSKYKEFVPWCVQSDVNKRDFNISEFKATLGIGFGPFREAYQSTVAYERPKFVQSTTDENSKLFKYLNSRWTFHNTSSGYTRQCELEFYVEFLFRQSIHSTLSNLFFHHVVTTMVSAFTNRASYLYGRETKMLS